MYLTNTAKALCRNCEDSFWSVVFCKKVHTFYNFYVCNVRTQSGQGNEKEALELVWVRALTGLYIHCICTNFTT